MPAPTSESPEEREFAVDSGATVHMMSKKKKLKLRSIGYFSKIQESTVVLTANGEVHTNEEAQVFVHDLNLFVTVLLLEETPAVLSLGKLFEDHGYSCEWVSGQKPRLTKRVKDNYLQNGQLRTSCCSRVIHQFYEHVVVNKSSSGAK